MLEFLVSLLDEARLSASAQVHDVEVEPLFAEVEGRGAVFALDADRGVQVDERDGERAELF